MDPSLFHIDWEVLTELLITIIVLAFFIERALSLFFEHRLLITYISGKGLKELITFLLSLIIAKSYGFDALAVLFNEDTSSWLGHIITAAIIAGGSKASIKLFKDIMGVRSKADAEFQAMRATKKKKS